MLLFCQKQKQSKRKAITIQYITVHFITLHKFLYMYFTLILYIGVSTAFSRFQAPSGLRRRDFRGC